MRIAILAPSSYMSPAAHPDRIYAPRIVMDNLATGLANNGHAVTYFTNPGTTVTNARIVTGSEKLLKQDMLRDRYLDQENILQVNKTRSIVESENLYAFDLIEKAYSEARRGAFDIVQTDDRHVHPFVDMVDVPTVFLLHDPLPRENTVDSWQLNRYKEHNFVSISNSQQRGKPTLNFVGTVYHGVSFDEFTPSYSDGEYFVYFGRLLAKKGPHHAITAVKKAEEQLHIAAGSTYDETEFVRKKITPFVDDKRVKRCEYISNMSEKNKYLQKAKAFIFPLQWDEPFGLTMIEAMACGTPVIAYNRGSAPEIIEDGVTGFIVDQDDGDWPKSGQWSIKKRGVDGLVEALHRIDEIDRRACRNHVEKRFSVDTMIEGYEKIYNTLVRKK